MKSIKYSLVSFFFLLSVNNIFACWHSWHTPAGYRMYRVVPTETSKDKSATGGDLLPSNSKNCAEWQKLTSHSIPKEDIEHVVYKMTLQNFEEIYDNRKKKYKNKFAEWITKRDTTILEFLHLAKSNEYIREQMTSPWYYPTMSFNARMSIEEIAEKAVAVKDMRLRNRYLLQAMRAFMSMEKYKECVEIWDNELSKLPKNDIIRRLSEQYYVGALFHVKHSEKAVEYFAQNGDIGSILYCTDQIGKKVSPAEAISLICKYAPNSSKLPLMLHNFIRKIEPLCDLEGLTGPYKENEDTKLLYTHCIEMGKNPKVKNQAMWYYTAAFLADLKNDLENASKYISLAEKAKSSTLIDESIYVFKIYLDAKTSTYDSKYERKLHNQLKWLDKKIITNITDDVKSETSCGINLIYCYSYYYWNDMMRRILLAEVCPRMIKVGNTTRALQLANMASNRLPHIVNSVDFFGEDSPLPIRVYRYTDSIFNEYDYSNHFFEMIDSLGAENALKYVANTSNPVSKFDRFLNNRGYTDSNYLYDIVGTQYLRNMQYAQAEKYLKRVDESIDAHLNVELYYNPFSTKKTSKKASKRFKYDFAKKMNKLAKTIFSHKDPNIKAKAMFDYASGLLNSFDFCWPLTQYYKGEGFWNRVCIKREWENDQYTKAATDEATKLFKLAIETATDTELKAEMEYALCNFRTVAEKYPNTIKGQLVRGACDKLSDYHIENNRPTAFEENPETRW